VTPIGYLECVLKNFNIEKCLYGFEYPVNGAHFMIITEPTPVKGHAADRKSARPLFLNKGWCSGTGRVCIGFIAEKTVCANPL